MKNSLVLLLILTFTSFSILPAQVVKQVEIETKFVEVEETSKGELGFDWLLGPSIGAFTNQQGNNNAVVGVNFGVGINKQINPVVAIGSHVNIKQFGQKNVFNGGSNQFKVTNLGIDVEAILNVLPKRKVETQVIVGADMGVNIGRKFKNEFNGVKSSDRPPINNDLENRLFAALFGGVGATVRTDVGDFSLRFLVMGGLVEFFKDPNDVRERSVPLLVNIPVVYRFFGKREKTRDRENLIILVKPQIVNPSDD